MYISLYLYIIYRDIYIKNLHSQSKTMLQHNVSTTWPEYFLLCIQEVCRRCTGPGTSVPH